MAEITASLVKQLREKTGAGMMECKSALVEANGDLAEAEVVLRKRGMASAAKKSARSAKQGLIGVQISAEGKLGVLVEVNCESDFVARTEEFQQMVASMGALIAEKAPADAAALMATPTAEGPAVEEMLKSKIAKIGENMVIPRFARCEAAGVLGSYVHPGSQLAVLVDVTSSDAAATAKPEFAEVLHDIAMQVAAADPKFVSKDEVTAEYLEKEKDIQRARALAEGKPEKIVDKVVEGRMAKYYEEVCLLEQPFIKENSVTISQYLADKGKALGATLGVAGYVRFKVGETGASEETAAE
ncbi:MAG: elongation factor Ts [Bryobacteraceae bacterium]|nr:elongation factor Ts [Bryobacteraceae bacterium]HAX41060.1 elongation factor Ts [Bryobacterales bacterium]HRJ17602.1 translation elongation factor Ts [Bryobacteraceae bacterium]